MNIDLRDIIKLADLDAKSKLQLAADLVLNVLLNLPKSKKIDPERLYEIQKDIRKI